MTNEKAATEPKVVTVYHPTLDASRDVDAGDVKEWTKAGWLTEEPKRD